MLETSVVLIHFCLGKKSKAVTATSNRFQDLSAEDEEAIEEAPKETWPTPKEAKDGKVVNKKKPMVTATARMHSNMLQVTRKAVWKLNRSRREVEPPVRDGNVSFPRHDTDIDLQVKKVRFCDVEPMQIPFSPAQKADTKASNQIRRAQLDIESGDEGLEDFGSESDDEATAVRPEKPNQILLDESI